MPRSLNLIDAFTQVGRRLFGLAGGIAGAACLAGWLAAQRPGLAAGAIGGGIVLAMAGLEAEALRLVARHPALAMAAILGSFLGKALLMLAALLVGRLTATTAPAVLFLTLVAGILGTTALEVHALARIRPLLDPQAGTSGPRGGE